MILPIVLALAASALKRYPLHGRLILELVPALLILIALGTDTIWQRDPGRIKIGYTVVLFLLFAYPTYVAVQNSFSVPLREFNRHGDVRKNLFMT